MIIIPQGTRIRIKSELQRLAEGANAVTSDVRLELTLSSEDGPSPGEIEAVRAFTGAATPAAVLDLIAEMERLKRINFDYQMGSKAEAEAADEARREAKRWKGMVHMMVTQEMPRESIPDLPGWSKVVEARELVAEVARLEGELATLRKLVDAPSADQILVLGARYWQGRSNLGESGAVKWVSDDETGALLIFTRGEYRDHLIEALMGIDCQKAGPLSGGPKP